MIEIEYPKNKNSTFEKMPVGSYAKIIDLESYPNTIVFKSQENIILSLPSKSNQYSFWDLTKDFSSKNIKVELFLEGIILKIFL